MENEKRLIYADVAIEKCNKLLDNSHSCPYPAALSGVELVRDLILSECETGCPTVEAMEVVHGRWEDVRETEMYVPDMKYTITKTAETCSECKARISFVGAKRYLFDTICSNCGAKMDGGNEDG